MKPFKLILKPADMAFIFCPPLSRYPEQPKDMSACTLIDCTKCNQKMWLSENKKAIIKDNIDKKIMLNCYDCFIKFAKKNPEYFNLPSIVNI